MRISDWSSDVCSSDLHQGGGGGDHAGRRARARRRDLALQQQVVFRRQQDLAAAQTAGGGQHTADQAEGSGGFGTVGQLDQKNVVWGRSVTGSDGYGGRRQGKIQNKQYIRK